MKFFFRVDASLHIGTGHLMRCLTLAEALQECGEQAQFISFENVFSQSEDACQTLKVLNGKNPDWFIVDHYHLGLEWEQLLRPHVGRLMVIDDLFNRPHDCDVLLDQNYASEGERSYDYLVPSPCKKLLGPRYALLRKEFKVMREALKPKSHKIKNILVFFTSGDDRGETLKAMQGIELFGKAERVNVIVGQFTPQKNEIMKKCAALGLVYHCQVDNMPVLLAQADLAIGAGGSSNWERCALGVPALVTILAENQAPIADALDRAGVICNLGWGRELQAIDYANALAALSSQQLAVMSEKALELVDAKGAQRVANLLFTA